MYQSVIVPLDGTDHGERALPIALDFARKADATLHLLTIVEAPHTFTDWSNRGSVNRWRTELEDEARGYLDDVALSLDYANVRSDIAFGEPLKSILAAVEMTDQPLLVIARRPRSAMRERISRGLSIRIARHTPCPLVIATAQDAYATDTTFTVNSVLVPLDGSHNAERILPALTGAVLNPADLQFRLLRVIETASWHGSSQALMYSYNLDRYVDDMREIASPYLSDMRDKLGSSPDQVVTDVRAGHVVEQICLAADEWDVDLIAMSTHGRSGVERFMLGSIAESVVINAHRPVLLVRTPT